MKQLPFLLALMAIAASGYAIPPKFVPDRTKSVPEPISLCVDDLALAHDIDDEFDESLIPEAIRMLDGKRVRVVGQRNVVGGGPVTEFVFHGFTKQGLDLFNRRFELYIPVTLRKGTTSVSTQPIEVEGRLVIRPTYREGKLTYLYHIEDAVVRPTAQPDGFYQVVLPVFLC